MPAQLRRRLGATERETDEGPFVSFTDLFIGILFLFLILVAALMLMHQEAVQRDKIDAQLYAKQVKQMSEQLQQMQDKLKAIIKLDADQPPFRLAMVYNVYQKEAGVQTAWTYSRSVQVFVAPKGLCLNNIILRNNLNFAWKPPVAAASIPTATSQDTSQMGTPCRLSALGDHWNSASETGSVERTAANLYSGTTSLHKKDGEEKLELQYRVLGVYDDYYRQPGARGRS
jgi:Na+-transporting methylmalonyl-CoA/oxaloacetate decarboxylase gamma subunit